MNAEPLWIKDGKTRRDRNEKHVANPEPGDFWQEMLCPILVVLDVRPSHVTFCEATKDVGNNRWTWNLEKATRLPRSEFSSKLRYGSIDGFWCDVVPRSHEWAAEAWRRDGSYVDVSEDWRRYSF